MQVVNEVAFLLQRRIGVAVSQQQADVDIVLPQHGMAIFVEGNPPPQHINVCELAEGLETSLKLLALDIESRKWYRNGPNTSSAPASPGPWLWTPRPPVFTLRAASNVQHFCSSIKTRLALILRLDCGL